MKLMNYDKRTLIMQNVKSAEKNPTPDKYTKTQYRILCNLIKRKHIQKPLFDFTHTSHTKNRHIIGSHLAEGM